MSTRVLRFLAVATALGCGGVDDERDPVWGYISPMIIQPNCATSSCHSKGAAVAGLDLSTAAAGWDSLRKLHLPEYRVQPSDPQPPPLPRPLVTPSNPEQSRVVNMLRASGARRMPPDRPLPEADIRLIERWILNGALDD